MASWSTWGDRSPAGRGVITLVRLGLYGMLVAGLVTVMLLGVGLARLSGQPDRSGERPLVVRPKGGSLVIVGGRTTDEIRDHFVDLAGGHWAKLVVIPTASNSPDSPLVLSNWERYGMASVLSLHARTREDALKPGFAGPLADATGVWFSGGYQERLAARYLGTDVETQLQGVLSRGGVIGGTSAGAAVMTRVMIAGGRGQAKLDRGFDLLPDAVVDQHFIKRNRLGRLLGVLKQHPGLLGLGVDEETALVVDVRGHRARVYGKSYVVACVPGTNADSTRVEFLKPGDEADLTALRSPTEQAIAPAVDFDAF